MDSVAATSGPAPVDVVIVGAGLAGLATAVHLHEAGRTVRILEASDGVGGRVRTDEVDGFLLDRGFQVLLTAYPEVPTLLDVDALQLGAFEPGAAIRHQGRFHTVSDPFRRPAALMRTALTPVIGLGDKLRIAKLRQRVTRGAAVDLLRAPDTTTEEHLRSAGFSETAIDRLFRPLFGGIQLDPSLATSSRMFDIVYRCLATGDSALPAHGMGAIPHQLAERLPTGTIQLNQRVVSVDRQGATTDAGTRHLGDHVVVAAEGPAAAALLDLKPVASHAVSCCWFAAPQSPVAKPLLFLDADNSGPALNVAMMSEAQPQYAPTGQALIAAACPRPNRGPDLGPVPPSQELAGEVTAQMRSWFGEQVDEWRLLRVDHIEHAQPVQVPPFSPRKRVTVADRIWVSGDHRDTSSIQGALHSGRRVASAILAS